MNMLGNRVGAQGAAHLLGRTLASSTQSSYQRLWEGFASFCELDRVAPLPASPATIACYLGFLYDKGTVRGGSIRPYIAAVGAQHRRCGLPDPTSDPLVSSTKRGFVACDAARTHGAPRRSAALPAFIALRALHRALRSTTVDGLRRWGMLALGFLLCSRPTALRNIQRADVQLGAAEITVQLRVFKYGESGSAPRVALRIPVSSTGNDLIASLFTRLCRASRGPTSYLFAGIHALPLPASTLGASMLALVSRFPPPAGTKWTARSLRSGGISAAYASGVDLPVIMRLSNHTSADVVHKHYLDALVPPSAAARVFFSRFTAAGQPPWPAAHLSVERLQRSAGL